VSVSPTASATLLMGISRMSSSAKGVRD